MKTEEVINILTKNGFNEIKSHNPTFLRFEKDGLLHNIIIHPKLKQITINDTTIMYHDADDFLGKLYPRTNDLENLILKNINNMQKFGNHIIEFNGDIIITDPCYLSHNLLDSEIWDNIDADSGNEISKLGFTSYIWDTTLYGDWTCTVFEIDNSVINMSPNKINNKYLLRELGTFTADAGLVGVFYLNEVLKFNPNFVDFIKQSPHSVTIIKQFKGSVHYQVVNKEVYLSGTGNINFLTKQTGI